MFSVLGLLGLLFSVTSAKIYLQETFDTDPFAENRWVVSDWKQNSGEAGTLEYSGGLWGNEGRNGIRTTEDARFYAFSTTFEEFDNTDKTLVFGYRVKHEQKMDCGGAYAKLLPVGTDQSKFNGDSPYSIMFGPDICGYSTKKVHAIFNYNGENLLKQQDVKCPDDEFTHTYILVVNPDDTYDIIVDGNSEDSGNLKDAWAFELPKTIPDPDASKPEDWVDNKMMDDPDDVKPEDWDDEPAMIEDPDAIKPEDWDDEEDGEWEAPMVDNPEYKGPWRAKRIENPDYKGPWEHPHIDNPEWVEHSDVYKRGSLGVLGVEVWQVKSGTVFSDFILADNLKEVEEFFAARTVSKEDEENAKTLFDAENREDIDDMDATDFDEEDADEPPKVDL